MASISSEDRVLKDKERIFVHMLVYEGMDKLAAYVESHGLVLTEDNELDYKSKASKIFYKPNVNRYYHALLEEVREKEVDKGLWTKEVATNRLIKLMDKAEKELYGDLENGEDPKNITMARVNAIVLPAKELNLMYGFNQTNMNIEGGIVQIYGESEIPD